MFERCRLGRQNSARYRVALASRLARCPLRNTERLTIALPWATPIANGCSRPRMQFVPRLTKHDVERRLFRLVTVKEARPPAYSDEDFEVAVARSVESTRRFFSRFDGALHVAGKSVLDIGCGLGTACIESVHRGAANAVGVDIQPLDWARRYLDERHAELADRIQFVSTDGSLREVGDRRFDVVISKDSFEHYQDPEGMIALIERLLAPRGVLAIGFGPLWKSPTGGHLGYMTKLPWAHLTFSEEVLMEQRRRFRPAEDARSFDEIRGGLNKMTLARFARIMRDGGLRLQYFATNVSDNRVVRAMDLVSRVPQLREYFTANVYSVWEKTETAPDPVAS